MVSITDSMDSLWCLLLNSLRKSVELQLPATTTRTHALGEEVHSTGGASQQWPGCLVSSSERQDLPACLHDLETLGSSPATFAAEREWGGGWGGRPVPYYPCTCCCVDFNSKDDVGKFESCLRNWTFKFMGLAMTWRELESDFINYYVINSLV